MKALKVPRSTFGFITEEIWNHPKPLFLDLKLNNWRQRASEILCKNKRGCQKDNHLCSTPSLELYGKVVRAEATPEEKAWLCFAKQHLNDPQSMKERFSGLMRQELNSLAWIPIAISRESQTLLITIPMGKHDASPSFHISWSCFWAAGLKKTERIGWEKLHFPVLTTLLGCSYLLNNMVFSTALQVWIGQMISVFAPVDSAEISERLLRVFISQRIHWDHPMRDCLLL